MRKLLLLLWVTAACTPAMQDDMMRDIAKERVSTTPAFLDEPGLQVLICGSAGPINAPGRASACAAVIAGRKIWIVDVGAGSAANFAQWGIPMSDLGGILLTHFHSDHITELGEYNLQSWAAGRDTPLAVYGPEGVADVVDGFNQAYEQSRSYRTAHHGADFLDPAVGLLAAKPFAVPSGPTPGEMTTVFERDGLVVRAFSVAHQPVSPAVGYRFDYEGRSVVVTGDTSKSAAVVAAAKGVDVLVHDAMAHHVIAIAEEVAEEQGRARNARIAHDIPEYHASAVQAAEVANEADAKLLVLYHLVPPPTNFIVERVFLRGVDDVRDEGIVVSHDGLLVELPPRSEEIDVDSIAP